jgi:hypothetical protein
VKTSDLTNVDLVPKFHVASHAALAMATSKFRPNIALSMLDQTFILMQPFQALYQKNLEGSQALLPSPSDKSVMKVKTLVGYK